MMQFKLIFLTSRILSRTDFAFYLIRFIAFVWIIFIGSTILATGCNSKVDNLEITSVNCFEWENLGIEVQTVYRLFQSGHDLYAAAIYDGLYALDLRKANGKWEYLGHRQTDDEPHFAPDIRALEVYDGEIRINSQKRDDEGQHRSIWLSKDRGKTWVPSDEGMKYIRTPDQKYRNIQDIVRSPHNPDLMFAGGGTIFRSEDGGLSWTRIGDEDYEMIYFRLTLHPADPDVIWAFGESPLMAPFLWKSEDQGTTWYSFRTPFSAGRFTSMAFDAEDSNIIYLGTAGTTMSSAIRSNEGGEEWKARNYTRTELKGYRILTQPFKGGGVIAGAGGLLLVSRDHGQTAHEIEIPSELEIIWDMWYDEGTDILYVAGRGGAFRCQDPFNAIP